MITQDEARQRVMSLVEGLERFSQCSLAIVDEETITKPYGWVYFYNSRRFLETRDILYGIAGNGPLIVLASLGVVVLLGLVWVPVVEFVAFECDRYLLNRG